MHAEATEHRVRDLDRKLQNIVDGRYVPDDFVIADAKDADMAFGVTAASPIGGDPEPVAAPGTTGRARRTSTRCAPSSRRASWTSC